MGDAKGNQTTEEINNYLLLATDIYGWTASHIASRMGHIQLLQILWECAKENLKTEEIINKLLLATDNVGWTVWLMVANVGPYRVITNIMGVC